MKYVFSPKTKKVLFFDLNQTIIDKQRSFQIHFIRLLDDYTGRWSAQESSDWNSHQIYLTYKNEIRRLSKSTNQRKRSRKELKMLGLKKALKPYPFDVDESFANHFFEQIQRLQLKEPQLFPKAIPTLKQLSQSYQLAILSNSSKYNLTKLGLSELFPEKYVFNSKKCGVRKPNVLIFKKALLKMKVKPDQAVMIGNSYRKDIQPAIRCGMDAIWLQRPSKKKVKSIRRIGKRKIVRIEKFAQLTSVFSV